MPCNNATAECLCLLASLLQYLHHSTRSHFGCRGFHATVMSILLSRVVNVSYSSAAAYGVKFYATEMAFASDSVTLTYARLGLNVTATELRTWHETVLYASSTSPPTSSELHYRQPAYRASPAVETVSLVTPCRCSAPQRPLPHVRSAN